MAELHKDDAFHDNSHDSHDIYNPDVHIRDRCDLEQRSAWRRDYRLNEFSLDEEDESKDHPVDRHENIGEDEYLFRIGKQVLSSSDLRDLTIDVNRVMEMLPPELGDLCERLKTKTVADISRDTGIPRGTIYEAIQKVREIFEKAGLKDYLKF